MTHLRKVAPAALIDEVLRSVLRSDAWYLEVSDDIGQTLDVVAKTGDVQASFPDFRGVLEQMVVSGDAEHKTFVWIDPDPSSLPDTADPGDSLLAFVHPVDADEYLIGGVICDRVTVNASLGSNQHGIAAFIKAFCADIAHLRRLRKERLAIRQLLSTLAVDCVLVDKKGQIIYTRGDDTLQLTDASRPQPAKAVDAKMRAVIDRALEVSASAEGADRTGRHVMLVNRSEKEVAPVHVIPLSAPEEGADFLALMSPRPSETINGKALMAAFSLTPAEATVVHRVVRGMKIKDIAKDTARTEQTIRTYLKRTFTKLGVSCQSELVEKVRQFSVPIGQTDTDADGHPRELDPH